MSNGLWKIALLLCFSPTLARTVPSAAILPFSGLLGTKEDESNTQQRPAGVKVPPVPPKNPRKPPPPPPPPKDEQQTTDKSPTNAQKADQRADGEQYNDNPDYPSHPPQFWAPGPFDHYGGLPPPPPGWMGPPPDWQQHQSEWQLDEFLAREKDLLSELHNLTSTLASYEQREDLHMRQLDVLTERVMDVESAAAMERNDLAEYRSNCTELGRTVAVQRDEIEEWTQRCRNLTIQHEHDEDKMSEMRRDLKARSREVEDFASAIEVARLDAERNKYLAERKKKQKKRGFLYWLFGIGKSEEREEDRLQEYARATLLRALQTERDSVEELENAVATLQQNNSAIAEMVESRDMLVDELNNRVAVFEEDKLVLKAALRQLQKEMKEEAPKTQKLIDDLKEARENVQRLSADIDSIIADHQSEVKLLQHVISEKQNAINATESNMTVIGTYVDKLEERLATFALARRDIDIREKKCQVIEERVVVLEQESAELQKQAKEYETEHGELKSLLEDLANERSELQKQVAALSREKEGLSAESQLLKGTIESLEIDVSSLGSAVEARQSRVTELESTVQDQASELKEKGERENTLEDILHETLHKMKQMEETSRADKLAAEAAQLEAEAAAASRAAELEAEAAASRAAELETQAAMRRAAELEAEAAMRQDHEPEQYEESMVLSEDPQVNVDRKSPPPPPPGGEQAFDESSFDAQAVAPHDSAPQQDHVEEPLEHSSPPVDEKEESASSTDDEMTLGDSAPDTAVQDAIEKTLPQAMEAEAVEQRPAVDEVPPSDSESEGGEVALEEGDDVYDSESETEFEGAGDVANVQPEAAESSDSNAESDEDPAPSLPDVTTDGRSPSKLPPINGRPELPPSRPNKVPFRGIRKVFSSRTGVHGLFSSPQQKQAKSIAMAQQQSGGTVVGAQPDETESNDVSVETNEGGESDDSGAENDDPSLPKSTTDGHPPSLGPPRPRPGSPPPRSPNKVPLRGIRKTFSSRTGIHGLFTRPSRFYPTREQKRQAKLRYKQQQKQAKLVAKEQRNQNE